MSPLSYWSKHAGVDWSIATAVAAGYGVARALGVSPIVVLQPAGRSDLYGSLVQAAGGVLAFALVPAAIVLALVPGPRVKRILAGHSEDLRRATVHAAAASIGLLVAAIAGQAVDSDTSNTPVRYLTLVAAVAAVLGILRLVDQFSILLRNVGQDQASSGTTATGGRRRLPRVTAQGVTARSVDEPADVGVTRRSSAKR